MRIALNIAALCWCILPLTVDSVAQAPSVTTVENAGLLFTDNTAGVSGTDAGYSVPLGSQTLWLFGDVFLLDSNAPDRPYVGALSNCGLLVSKGSGVAPLRNYRFFTNEKGLARRLIDSDTIKGDNLRFWPFGGWFDPVSKRVNLFYARVRTTGDGPFAFKTEGFGLTTADAANPSALRFRPVRQEIWWHNEAGKPMFGSAVLPVDDDLYVVGFQERSGRKFGKLARVPKSRVTDFSAYRYFAAGDRWSTDLAEAADVEGLTDFPTELSLSYNAYLGGYLAVHSIGIGGKARLSLAANPWGPYKTIAEIGTPARALSKGFCYAGKEHPELAEQGGQVIYVTFVDSSRYWLQLLKVTLQK